MTFTLDPELEKISAPVGSLPVSELRLLHDGRFDWVMLMPRVPNASEWHHLSAEEMAAHAEEIRVVSHALDSLDPASEVVNVGMFGHGVKQLHVHMAARSSGDSLWPGIAFMTGPPEPRSQEGESAKIEQFRQALSGSAAALGSNILNAERVTS